MDTAIRWIKHKPAYERARFLSPEFVDDRDLRLALLRSVGYDAVKAAKHLVHHFEFKKKLFGLNKLVHPITQDDLSENMLSTLQAGYHQLTGHTDRVGRAVIFVSAKQQPVLGWKDYVSFSVPSYSFLCASVLVLISHLINNSVWPNVVPIHAGLEECHSSKEGHHLCFV